MNFQKLFVQNVALMVFSMALFFGLAQVSLVSAANHETDNPPCYDITGSSTALYVAGVPNGGTMNFDDNAVTDTYQACVRMSSNAANAVPDHLEGWVWDSNLGWVSLYCPGGGAQNLGADCGSVTYSVTFITTGTAPDFDSVKLTGYAWGDNVGYISFNDTVNNNFQTAAIASGPDRGLIDASLTVAGYHAWADAVGWLDLRGVHLYWKAIVPSVPDQAVLSHTSICSVKDASHLDGGCDHDLDTVGILTDAKIIPDANPSTNDEYKIKISFMDGGENVDNSQIEECPDGGVSLLKPSANANIYCAKIGLTWEDDVDLDQTTADSQKQGVPKFNFTSGGDKGAVIKPLVYALDGPGFSYDIVDKLWGATVQSFAPTSERNVTDGMQNEKFYYVDAATSDGTPATYNKDLIGQNKLILKEMNLMFFKYSTDGFTPGVCIYGAVSGGNCGMKNYLNGNGATFSFNPLVEVTELLYKKAADKWINFISASSIDNEQDFKEQVSGVDKVGVNNPIVSFNIGLANSGGLSMKWVDNFLNATVKNSFDVKSTTDAIENTWMAKIFTADPAATITADAGPYVYTKVNYTVGGDIQKNVAYFGAKLPRVNVGLLFNPVAKVEGNVYVTDFAQKAAEVSLKSLGNIASNLRREAVVRNVAKYLAGYSGNIVENASVKITDPKIINGLSELVAGSVYYLKGGKLTIDCNGPCTFNKNVTFIVENGNIFVNSDIRSVDGTTQVGLIALRNLDGNVQNEGFLYLDQYVGWLQNVQIYLDRVAQSYVSTAGQSFDSNGFFLMNGDDYARQDAFNNQLVIEGTISSMNGVGNASRVKPVYETGAEIAPLGSSCANYADTSLGGICRARVTDLNYLRYYGPGLILCKSDEGPNAVANVPQDQKLKAAGDLDQGCNPDPATGYSIDAKGIYADPSTSPDNGPDFDMVAGGGAGLRSVYFDFKNLPKTLQNEYPVNFFYKPISKDLKGFEVDQNVSPVTQ